MALKDPKKVGACQVLGPESLVSFTVSSFSIDRYCFQQSFKCNTYGEKCVKTGVNWDQRAPNWHSLPCNSDWSQVSQQFKVVKHFNKNRYKSVLVGS